MTIDVGRIGVWTRGASWPQDKAEVADAAAELEELGYGAVWVGSSTKDLSIQTQQLAATTRLVAATGIVNVWSEPAADVAEAFARLNVAHPGRLLLGIGAGHAKFVEAGGQRYARPYSKVVEYLDQLDQAGVPTQARAVAALGPRTIALAGARSAGAHPYLVTPEHTRMARGVLGDGPLLAPEQKVILETDRDKAREIAAPVLEFYLGLPNYASNLERIGFTEDDIKAGGRGERLFEGLFAWGDPARIAEKVAEHHRAGADHVGIQVLTGADTLPRAQWRDLAPALMT